MDRGSFVGGSRTDTGVLGKVAAPGWKVGGKCRGAGEKHQAQVSNQPSRKEKGATMVVPSVHRR
jgi:hypothetical protein